MEEKKAHLVSREHCIFLFLLYTYHFNLLFCFFFLVASLFLGNLRQEAEVFIHTRLLRVNTITWKSKKSQQCIMLLNLYLAKMSAYFYFLFSHSNLFLVHGLIFDM